MSKGNDADIGQYYRVLYGKLFSSLIKRFGANRLVEIEDVIQNSFIKLLRIWSPALLPDQIENWLYTVAKNDLLNQVKARDRTFEAEWANDNSTFENHSLLSDMRLDMLFLISSAGSISKQAKVLFVLKNLFGLSVSEISDSTLIGEDAIYKLIKRTNNKLKIEFKDGRYYPQTYRAQEISTVEEILYAVFNLGFDSFDKKSKSMVNEDLCFEAVALAKLLVDTFKRNSSKNLMSLFCFHAARLPAKVADGKLITFFKQDRNKWDKQLMSLGFKYLEKSTQHNRFYIEALIIMMHMTAKDYHIDHWHKIIHLYELLLIEYPSAIVKLNLSIALNQAKKREEALNLIREIEHEFPSDHFYFNLIKARILNPSRPIHSNANMTSIFENLTLGRKEFLLEERYFADKNEFCDGAH